MSKAGDLRSDAVDYVRSVQRSLQVTAMHQPDAMHCHTVCMLREIGHRCCFCNCTIVELSAIRSEGNRRSRHGELSCETLKNVPVTSSAAG